MRKLGLRLIVTAVLIGVGSFNGGVAPAGPAGPEISRPAGATRHAGSLPDDIRAKELVLEREISLDDLARRRFPGPLRRDRFMRWVVEANPRVFAGAADLRRHRLSAGLTLLVPEGVPPRRPGDHRDGSSPLAELARHMPAASIVTPDALVPPLPEQPAQPLEPTETPKHWWLALAALCGTGLSVGVFLFHRQRTAWRRGRIEVIAAARPVVCPVAAASQAACSFCDSGVTIDAWRDPAPGAFSRRLMDSGVCDSPVMDAVPVPPLAPEVLFHPRHNPAEQASPAMIAIELANVMSAMGLVNSAAQTLAQHLTGNPHEVLRHWLKLLELYRSKGDYTEQFARSADELRQHFNVHVDVCQSAWDGAAFISLECHPHVCSQLAQLWGKPQCLPFLQSLLLDNRGGTRAGFPLSVAEEILMLISIQDK